MPGPVEPQALSSGQADRVTAELREAILRLDILPGAVLTERGLEKRFGASRTPSRAALGRCETEGLVERDGRGWRVTSIDVEDLVKILEFRLIVESAAIRIVSRVASDQAIAALMRAHGSVEGKPQERRIEQEASASAAIEDGELFHRDLTALSENRYLEDALDASLTRLARSRWLVVTDESSRAEARAAHHDVIEAISRRDPDAAAAVMERHLRESNDAVVEILRRRAAGYRFAGVDLGGPTAKTPSLRLR